MIKYKLRSVFLEKFLVAEEMEQKSLLADERRRSVNGNRTHEFQWDELIELDGLDFRFKYRYHYMNVGSMGGDKVGNYTIDFTYVSDDNDFILHSICGYKSLEDFIKANWSFPELYIRIPDLNRRFGVPDVRLTKTEEINNRQLINNHFSLSSNYVLDIEIVKDLIYVKQCKYSEFDAYKTEAFRSYIINLYSNLNLNPINLADLIKCGYKLMGLDEIDELVEIYISEDEVNLEDRILFRRGHECLAIKNDAVYRDAHLVVGKLSNNRFWSPEII